MVVNYCGVFVDFVWIYVVGEVLDDVKYLMDVMYKVFYLGIE